MVRWWPRAKPLTLTLTLALTLPLPLSGDGPPLAAGVALRPLLRLAGRSRPLAPARQRWRAHVQQAHCAHRARRARRARRHRPAAIPTTMYPLRLTLLPLLLTRLQPLLTSLHPLHPLHPLHRRHRRGNTHRFGRCPLRCNLR